MIIGGGPIGLIMVQLAKYCGASTVILTEPVEWKRTLSLKLGADITIDPKSESVLEVINNKIKNINKTIECVGLKETIMDAIKFAGRGWHCYAFWSYRTISGNKFKTFRIV